MFLSKIWFFLVTMVAAVAITVALIMPRPAERAAKVQEDDRVRTACLVTGVLLRDNARARIQLTSEFAQAVRQRKLSRTLFESSKDEIISGQAHGTARSELDTLLESVSGTKPSFVWLLDLRGRVVTRSNKKDAYGDSVFGYYVVQDALDGYVRDDLWMMDDGLYRVAAAPVLTQSLEWAGAVVVGQAMDQDFALSLSENIGANISFYVDGKSVAASQPIQIHKDVVEGSKELAELDKGAAACSASTLLHVEAGGSRYAVVNASLPGEAGEQKAFYSVFIERAKPLNFMGMLKAAKKNDLAFGRFPWIQVIGVFLIMMVVGLLLTMREVDGPLKKLNTNAVALAQGETERFDEDAHRSKYGSIARSVNIAIDKMHRDAKAAKKDLDQLLGPAPSAVDAAASALPPIGPGGGSGIAAAPPPSEFKFGASSTNATGGGLDLGGEPKTPPPPMPGLAAAKAKKPPSTPNPDKTPPPVPTRRADSQPLKPPTDSHKVPLAIDADILGEDEAPTITDERHEEKSYFEQVYEEFIALKKSCGESTENLTFERFAKKLRKNEDALIAKHGCKSVKFQVYEKDGKAALKASPVK